MGHTYISKVGLADSRISWSEEEHLTWNKLLSRQKHIIQKYACEECIEGLNRIAFDHGKIPQHNSINKKLKNMTGWIVIPVPAIISDEAFHTLLSQRKFP